jgi:hypothetical protein
VTKIYCSNNIKVIFFFPLWSAKEMGLVMHVHTVVYVKGVAAATELKAHCATCPVHISVKRDIPYPLLVSALCCHVKWCQFKSIWELQTHAVWISSSIKQLLYWTYVFEPWCYGFWPFEKPGGDFTAGKAASPVSCYCTSFAAILYIYYIYIYTINKCYTLKMGSYIADIVISPVYILQCFPAFLPWRNPKNNFSYLKESLIIKMCTA